MLFQVHNLKTGETRQVRGLDMRDALRTYAREFELEYDTEYDLRITDEQGGTRKAFIATSLIMHIYRDSP